MQKCLALAIYYHVKHTPRHSLHSQIPDIFDEIKHPLKRANGQAEEPVSENYLR